jgi:diaminohydroxyphosphoribosylaminopyrimidine deaminase/5-amino-6-(5-phosphoribosylamino)uracil reductase
MTDEVYMRRCLELAQRGKGYAAPNPMVGAVLVHNGRIIAEGWHHAHGDNHAEVDCLNNVSQADKHLIPESTMYVNLEPCAHHGKTPPCAERLVKERIKEVVIANIDPFKEVSGKGMAILHAGGVATKTGIMEREGLWVNRRFFCFQQQSRPYIILKWAETADGFIAPRNRQRLQITGEDAQQVVHQWRTEEAAIMVGTNTALYDNPQLTARLCKGRQPLRIVIDRSLKLSRDLHVFDNSTATWIVNEMDERTDGVTQFAQLNFDENFLAGLLHKLFEAKILSLIVEGGAQLLESFIAAGLWDEARVFTGKMRLKNGIAAPELADQIPVMFDEAGADELRIFVNKQNAFPYSSGMEL